MEYTLIRHTGELSPYLNELLTAVIMGVDTETTGLDPNADRLRLVQIALPQRPVLIIDCFDFLPQGAPLLREIFAGAAIKIFHNAKFDLQFLAAIGVFAAPVFDTMLAAQLLRTSGGPQRANLAAVCLHFLNENVDKLEQTGDWTATLTQDQLTYAARDAALLLQLREAMLPVIYKNRLERIAKLEFDCVQAIALIEYAGIYLNQARWEALSQETERSLLDALEALYRFSGRPSCQLTLWGEAVPLESDSFESNAFVLSLLRQNGIDVLSTSKQHLAPYQNHPLVRALGEYRRCSKALSTFLRPLPTMVNTSTGRLHPKYGQIGAWSGRMSCSMPNIQQIPREASFRRCFSAPEGKKLVLADYSQIELRVAARISGDDRMKRAYQNGEDLHRLTASLISNVPLEVVTKAQRQAAKAVNFGLIFGMGAAGLQQYASQSYGVDMTLQQAESFRERYFKAYTGISRWHAGIQKAKPTEERTLWGRKFTFSQNAGAAGLYNTPVQGTAADITKAALALLAKRIRGTNSRIVAVVHDEILLETDAQGVQDVAGLLKDTMEQAGNAVLGDIPCVADVKIADSWAGK